MVQMNKIRILHMTPPIVNNGIYKYIFMLYKYIDKSRYEFEFLMQAPEELMKTKEYHEYGFKIRSFTTTQRENPEKFRKEIYDILSDGYDVLELHTSYWRGFMIEEIAMEIGIPRVIVHSHSSGLDNNDAVERDRQMKIHMQFKQAFGAQYATDFWACSWKAADWLYGDKIPRDKIKIINNAIEVEKYQYNPILREDVRKQLGLDNSFVIGHTGRFEYQKNHEFLLRVFKSVCLDKPYARLLLVGEGKLRENIEKYAEELGISKQVISLGWRNDIPELLQAMDMYCLPSRFEGLPIVMVEAQCADLKCITSSEVTEEAAILDDFQRLPLDEEVWIQNINQYISAPKKRDENIELIRKSGFDINTEIKNIEKLYSNKDI